MSQTNEIRTDGGRAEAQRGIINEEGKADRIPLIGWRKEDVIFVTLITLAGFFIIGPMLGGAVVWLATSSAFFAVSMGVLWLKPSSLGVSEAFKIGFEYVLQPSIIYAASDEAEEGSENEGGLLNYTPFSPSTRTQDMTGLKLAFPEENAVLTEDGRMETMFEIDGSNMDFAIPQEWEARQEIGQNFADRYVEDRINIFGTTSDFDFGAIIERIEQRLDDEDMTNTKVASAVLEEYYNRRPEQVQNRGTQETSVYLVVSVKKSDVTGGINEEQTAVEKVEKIPLIGRAASPFVDHEAKREAEEEFYQSMIEELDEMAKTVETALIGETKGYDGRRLSTIEQTTIASRVFNGQKMSADRVERVMKSTSDQTQQETTDRITAHRGGSA